MPVGEVETVGGGVQGWEVRLTKMKAKRQRKTGVEVIGTVFSWDVMNVPLINRVVCEENGIGTLARNVPEMVSISK